MLFCLSVFLFICQSLFIVVRLYGNKEDRFQLGLLLR